MAPTGASRNQSSGDSSASADPASRGTSTEAAGAAGAMSSGAPDARFPLFYRSLTPIDAARHASKSLKRRIGYDFARTSHAVLLNGSEFDAAARFYPIVFT